MQASRVQKVQKVKCICSNKKQNGQDSQNKQNKTNNKNTQKVQDFSTIRRIHSGTVPCGLCSQKEVLWTFISKTEDVRCCECLDKHKNMLIPIYCNPPPSYGIYKGSPEYSLNYVPAEHYTMCVGCYSTFKISKDYFGKYAYCIECRSRNEEKKVETYTKRSVPSLANTRPMLANIQQTPKVSTLPIISNPNWTEFELGNSSTDPGPISAFKEGYCPGHWSIYDGQTNPQWLSELAAEWFKRMRCGEQNMPAHCYAYLLDIEQINKVFLFEIGECDYVKPWDIIFKRKDGVYVHFRASCCYTGFDVVCGGSVNYSPNWTTFWNKCLDTEARSLLLPQLP